MNAAPTHYATPRSTWVLCGPELSGVWASTSQRHVTCRACLDIMNEWARGTVARTIAKRQRVQHEAELANRILRRRGYPLPDGQPIMMSDVRIVDAAAPGNDRAGFDGLELKPVECEHLNFGARIAVNRLSDTDDGPVTGYAADITICCADCGLPFWFLGLPAGYSPQQPMTNVLGTELRAPIAPLQIIDQAPPAGE